MAKPDLDEQGALALRPEQAADERFVFEVYASTRQEELDRTGWDEATRAAFLAQQFRAMRQGYAQMFPRAEFTIILHRGTAIGRVVVDRNAEEIRLVDLALSPSYRGRGVGTRLLRRFCAEAQQAGKPLRIRVVTGSPALRLYARLGFVCLEVEGLHHHLEWRAPG
ncbi:MAG: GNAT family N-acetyltransferase [Verrucomicrobia bacterium]|nr:GNAT family N-acetyltransferase [Verrucomicrobiota bacterium]